MVSTKDTRNIYQRVAAVRAEVPPLTKDGSLEVNGKTVYKFLAIDDILRAVKPLEVKHGIISVLESAETNYRVATGAQPSDGRVPRSSTSGTGTFTFRYINVEAENPVEDSILVVVPTEAADTSDKTARKLVTQAQKIANITLYNIITGEPDPDSQNGGADNQETTPAPVAKAKATSKPRTVTGKSADIIRQKFIDPVTDPKELEEAKKRVNGLVDVVKGEGLTGEALYAEVLKRLEA